MLRLHPNYRTHLRPRPLLQVRLRTSGVPDSHGVTGGVYKARERIHRGMLTQKTEEEMMKVRNLGRKSLKEVVQKLRNEGLDLKNSSSFNFDDDEDDDEE